MLAQRLTLAGCVSVIAFVGASPPEISAQPLEDPGATTELSCAFTMMQGQDGLECRVPFPQGCQVAHIPETNKPWTTISKGGRVSCRFDEKQTDWKTTITGACGRCRSNQCSAKFSVRFDCSLQQ
jgi:hypothetical protein